MHLVPKKDIIVASEAHNLGLGAIAQRKQQSYTSVCVCVENIIASWKKKYGRIEKKVLGMIHSWKKLYASNEPPTVTVTFWFQKKGFLHVLQINFWDGKQYC